MMCLRISVLKTFRAYLAAAFLVLRRAVLRVALRAPLRAPFRAVFLDFFFAAIINSLLAVVGCKLLVFTSYSFQYNIFRIMVKFFFLKLNLLKHEES